METDCMKQPIVKIFCAAILSVAIFTGCARPTMERLTGEEFDRKAKDASVDLYIGTYDGYYEPVAILNSISLPEKDNLAKDQQLEYLKKEARKLGADAIHEIRLLPREVRGYVQDENVPFRSWKQGVYYVYFLRGTAIRYVKEKESLYSFETEFDNL